MTGHHLVFERFSNLHIPTCHPVPWISGGSLCACNTCQKSPVSHPSHYSRTPSPFTVFPQVMAFWEPPQFLKAISLSLCTKTEIALETGCPCPPTPTPVRLFTTVTNLLSFHSVFSPANIPALSSTVTPENQLLPKFSGFPPQVPSKHSKLLSKYLPLCTYHLGTMSRHQGPLQSS